MKQIISLQLKFRKQLPKVIGNKDYAELENLLINIDNILSNNGFDMLAIEHIFKNNPKLKTNEKGADIALKAFRIIVLQSLIDVPFRKMSIEIAHSELYIWFVHIDDFASNEIRVPSKSTINRFEKYIDKEFINILIIKLTKFSTIKNNEKTNNPLKLKNALEIKELFADTTCIETNIHYPVDWKLLLDGVKTLIKSIIYIRKHGIISRIQNPKIFISEMNKLSIAISQSARVKYGKKNRKKSFRKMKKITRRVMKHAEKYLELLTNEANNHDFSINQVKNISNRMISILDQLPKAIKNAHERIIGERKVLNSEKIFSLYEKETEILVRKKSGKEVEFGNKLLIVENKTGLIVDYDFMKNQKNDSKLLIPIVKRVMKNYAENKIKSITTDRGFVGKKK